MTMDAETLQRISAQIDGELTAEQERALEAEIAADPALGDKRAEMLLADAAFRRECGAVGAPSMAMREGLHTAFADARRNERKRSFPTMAVASLAASLAVVAGGALWTESRLADFERQRGEEATRMAELFLQGALESMASGETVEFATSDDQVRVSIRLLRTYRSKSEHWCREFREQVVAGDGQQELAGVACRDTGGVWRRL